MKLRFDVHVVFQGCLIAAQYLLPAFLTMSEEQANAIKFTIAGLQGLLALSQHGTELPNSLPKEEVSK